MKIAVYPGSFNPLHKGHEAVIGHLAAMPEFGAVYLVVSPKNPLKTEISAESAQERFEAAKRAVQRCGFSSNVRADDIELHLPAPQYTIRTLDKLKEREPDNDFTLVTGADQLADIRRWKDYGRILSEYGIVVFPRNGIDTAALRESLLEENPDFKIVLADMPEVDISSTEIRAGISSGKDMSEFLM